MQFGFDVQNSLGENVYKIFIYIIMMHMIDAGYM